MKFELWLKEQVHRDDPIGDLAKDYIKARGMHREPYADYTDHNKYSADIKKQMEAWNACEKAYAALDEAQEEFNNLIDWIPY